VGTVERNTLLAYCLLVLLGFSIPVAGMQAGESIKSYGKIDNSMHSLVLKTHTANAFFTSIDAKTIANLFDNAQVSRWMNADQIQKVQEIKQNKQDFIALFYRLIRGIYDTSADWPTFSANNWILKDANGSLVYDTVWSYYLIDVGNPEYATWVANKVKETLDEYAVYDGVFADLSISVDASGHFQKASSQPINPRTGQLWKDEEIRQGLMRIHKEIKNAIGSKIMLSNGIWTGQRFWGRFDEYMEFLLNSSFDGVMSEAMWYRYDEVWMTEEEWLKSLNFLVFLQDNFLKDRPERFFVPLFKLKTTTGKIYTLPIGATEGQMLRYVFASTLLGIKNNQNYLGLFGDMNLITEFIQPLYDIDLGVPINDYYVIPNTHVYSRDFSNIKVLVNPASDPYVINLQGTFKTIDGQLVSDVVMDNHTGVLLIRVN